MISFGALQWVVAISHFLAGVSIVVLMFRGLEERPFLGLCLGGGVAGGVIYLDLLVGKALNPTVIVLGWARVEHLVLIAAATTALGIAMTALSLRPEKMASEQSDDAGEDQLAQLNE